jgi:hypothetical protein
MGGGGSKKNPLGYIGDALAFTSGASVGGLAGGLATTDGGQKVIDDAGLNPSANKTKIEDEGKKAAAEQAGRDAAMEENKTQAETAKKYAAKRTKQRGMMGATGGRSSTILTGLGDVGATGSGSGKTLLGS